jgi:hypothetical protein
MQPVSLQLPARAPEYVELPPTFTLKLQADKKWLMTCPDGQRVQTTEDRAVEWIRSVAPYCGSVVRFLDVAGSVFKVDLLSAPTPKAAARVHAPSVVADAPAVPQGPKPAALAARRAPALAVTSPALVLKPISLQLPARAPDYGVDLPPTFTLAQQADSTWLLTCPDGQRVQTAHDRALEWIRSVTPSSGSTVRFFNKEGRSFKTVHLLAPQSTAARQVREPIAAPAAPARQKSAAQGAPPFRLFLQEEPSTAPCASWGDWKVRPCGPDHLEVEASALISGTPISVVAYLVAADNHPGINAVALLGEMLNSLLEQRHKILSSAPAQAALQGSGCLRPLIESESVDDAGLGWCTLKLFQANTGRSESMLIWTDGQPSELALTPHARFLVQRTFHIALELISELLMLQQALTASAAPQAQSIWDQTDSTLDWLDANLARAGRILNVLADIFL